MFSEFQFYKNITIIIDCWNLWRHYQNSPLRRQILLQNSVLPNERFQQESKHVFTGNFNIGFRVNPVFKTFPLFRTIRLLNQLSTGTFFQRNPILQILSFQWNSSCNFSNSKLWRNVISNIVIIQGQFHYPSFPACYVVGAKTQNVVFHMNFSQQLKKLAGFVCSRKWTHRHAKNAHQCFDNSRIKALFDFWDYPIIHAGMQGSRQNNSSTSRLLQS